MIIHSFIISSAVQIYEFSYIHYHKYFSATESLPLGTHHFNFGYFLLTAAIIRTGEEWAELAVLTFVNMCTDKGLDKEETIRYGRSAVLTASNECKRDLT